MRDILADWALVEADFQREYGINLVEALPTLSWRRFVVLLNGLSTDSLYVLVEQGRKDGTVPIDDPEIGERIAESFFR